jgi:hypothetical protein
MSDPGEREEPVNVAPEVPLDQTTAPIDYLKKGPLGEVPLDQTRSEMREVLGSEGVLPPRRRRRS